jgi:hypothetical protein
MKTLAFGRGREIKISIEEPRDLIAGAGLHGLVFCALVKAYARSAPRTSHC